jgi:dihydroneopterin aldolase
MEKIADKFQSSKISKREQAIFETGIKLATIFHQFSGTPLTNDAVTKRKIADGIEASISCQPYVSRVSIDFTSHSETEGPQFRKSHEFDYTEISGRNLIAEVEIQFKNWKVTGCMKWIEDLNYPLMYIKDISNVEKDHSLSNKS